MTTDKTTDKEQLQALIRELDNYMNYLHMISDAYMYSANDLEQQKGYIFEEVLDRLRSILAPHVRR